MATAYLYPSGNSTAHVNYDTAGPVASSLIAQDPTTGQPDAGSIDCSMSSGFAWSEYAFDNFPADYTSLNSIWFECYVNVTGISDDDISVRAEVISADGLTNYTVDNGLVKFIDGSVDGNGGYLIQQQLTLTTDGINAT